MSEISENSFFVAGGPGRRPGRPRCATPKDQRVTIRLTAPEYDRLIGISLRNGEPVTAIVRSLLNLRIQREYSSANNT